MKEKLGGAMGKVGKFAPIVAGIVILLSIITGFIGDTIWQLGWGIALKYFNYNFLGGFLLILVAAACAATYFEKKVAFGAAGAFAIIAVSDFFSIFERIINVVKSIISGDFTFQYFISFVIGVLCNLLSFVGFAAMVALVVMALVKPGFKFLKFWYAPAALVLISSLVLFVTGFIGSFEAVHHLSWRMPYIVALILYIITSLIDLISIILVPAGMALYAKHVCGFTNNQIEEL